MKQPLGVPPPRDEEASLQQRQQERPSRNGAALCPEFVPRRSSCSFTRGDKSGASLSHTLSLVLYLFCVFLCREPTTLPCTELLFGTLTLPLRLCRRFFLSTCYRVVLAFLQFQKIIVIARVEKRDEQRPVYVRVSLQRRNNTDAQFYRERCIAVLINSLDNLLPRRFRSISRVSYGEKGRCFQRLAIKLDLLVFESNSD